MNGAILCNKVTFGCCSASHGNFQDPADVRAHLLEFALFQVDKCPLDVSPEDIRRSLWPHRVSSLQVFR